MKFLNFRHIKYICKRSSTIIRNQVFFSSLKPPWNILFFGTDTFSVYSLKLLNRDFKSKQYISNLEVVTSMKNKANPVEIYAKEEHLKTHKWPINLQEIKFHLGIVVSFGVLIPEDIINKFPLGMLNVHASLLPRWRGAAPIIYTIAHDDEIAGVTVMKIRPRKFDVGEIIKQSSIKVRSNTKLPELHDELASLGASTLISCIHELPTCLEKCAAQPEHGVTYAPKVAANIAHVRWDEMTARQVYALWRALYNLYPLTTSWKGSAVKLHDIELATSLDTSSKEICPGSIEYKKCSETLHVQCKDGHCVAIRTIGLHGKKPMSAKDFNNGFLSKEFIQNRKFH